MQGSFCGVWLYIKYAKIMTSILPNTTNLLFDCEEISSIVTNQGILIARIQLWNFSHVCLKKKIQLKTWRSWKHLSVMYVFDSGGVSALWLNCTKLISE